MDKDLELTKVRVLENHLQGNLNSITSATLTLIISITILSLSVAITTDEFGFAIFGIIVIILLFFYGNYMLRKQLKENLTFIDRLIKKIENGEKLPSLIELAEKGIRKT